MEDDEIKLKNIIKLTKEMGIEIKDATDGVHYIDDKPFISIKQITQNEQNDEYVYCTKCKHFRLSDKNIPYCKYENICNINNCEDSLELKDRPYYKSKNIFEKLADTVVDNDNLKKI